MIRPLSFLSRLWLKIRVRAIEIHLSDAWSLPASTPAEQAALDALRLRLSRDLVEARQALRRGTARPRSGQRFI
jgi:hypothetical protein